MTPMNAYLIDPVAHTITQVTYSGNYEDIYKLIDCQTFDVARINNRGDGLFIDDEGLFVKGQSFFIHKDYPSPLAGRALVLGCNDEGDSTAPTVTLEELRASVYFANPININGEVVWIGLDGKRVRIEA